MTPFKQSHPDYAAYKSDHYVLSVTPGLISGLKGLISRFVDTRGEFKWAADVIRSHVPMEPSTNSNRPWLDGDLDDGLRALEKKPLHKFADAIGDLDKGIADPAFGEALEELLEEERFGFYIERAGSEPHWALRDEHTGRTLQEIEDTVDSLGSLCDQAAGHLEQAKRNLQHEDERARKDAVRDALSAVEALYKALSGKADIADAWKHLRDNGRWGPTEIVKDGYVVWSQVQLAHSDIRHGQATASPISLEEAAYWIERLTVFVRYLARRAPG